MQLTIEHRDGLTRAQLRVEGDLDLAQVRGVQIAVLQALPFAQCLVVDLSAITFIDACGLSALQWVRRSARLAGVPCELVSPSLAVRRLATRTAAETVLGWPRTGPHRLA